MTEKPKLELVDTAPEFVFDDIEALRKTATIKVSRKLVPINVAVSKPKKMSISDATRTRHWRWRFSSSPTMSSPLMAADVSK